MKTLKIDLSDAPIFVVGSPRSGTHLMRYCLSQHSRIYIAPETGFFFKIYGNRGLIKETQISRSADKLIKKLFRSGDPTIQEFFGIKEQLIDLVTKEAQSYRDIAILVFREFAKQKGKVRWGEKTPFHVYYIQQILTLFPNAKIINMHRDAKNVIASYLKSNHLPNDFILALTHYQLSVDFAQKYRKHIFTVKYEELTAEPELTLKKVCDYIGETFELSMLQPGMQDSSYNQEIMIFCKEIGINKEDKERWRSVLNPFQANFINFLFDTNNKSAFDPHYIKNLLAIIQRKSRLKFSIYKNSLGYENIKRFLKDDWS